MKKTTIGKILIITVIACGLVALSGLYPAGTTEGYFYDDEEWTCVEIAFDSGSGAEDAKGCEPVVVFNDPLSGEEEVLEIDAVEWDGKNAYIYVILPEGKDRFADYGFKHGEAACRVIWNGGETECTYWK